MLLIMVGLTDVLLFPLASHWTRVFRSGDPQIPGNRPSLRSPGPGFLWKLQSGGRARAERGPRPIVCLVQFGPLIIPGLGPAHLGQGLAEGHER